MTPPLESEVQELHACYCRYVNWRMPLNFSVRHCWERYLHEGYTLEDLNLVLKRWSLKIAGGMDAGVLRFSRLIGDPVRFGEDLAIAHAEKRNGRPAVTPKQRVIQQARPVMAEQRTAGTDARPVGYWIEQLRKAAE